MTEIEWVPDRDELRKQTMCQNPIYLLRRKDDDSDVREFLPDVFATPQEAEARCPRNYEPYAVFAQGLLARMLDAHWPGPDSARKPATAGHNSVIQGPRSGPTGMESSTS